MPTFIAPVVAWATGLGVGTAAVTAISYAITLIGSLALSSAQKRKAERAQRAAYDASVVDRLVNTQSTVGSRELVLGRTRKGGNVFFQTSVAPHNAVFLTCIALASHEIAAVERIFFNDQAIDIDGDGNVTTAPWGRFFSRSATEELTSTSAALGHTPVAGTVVVIRTKSTGGEVGSSEYEKVPFTLAGTTVTIATYDPASQYRITYQWTDFQSVARVYWHLGSPGQAADSRLQSFLPGTWTPAHRAAGVAYLECEFVYEESAFPNGLPNVTAQIAGAKVYDPRTGTTVWSENPALLMRHVLTHPQFGRRTSLTAAEDARIIAAANACELPISYYGTDLVSIFRAATVVQFGATAREVLDDLAQAMGGEWAYASGEFYVRAGVYQAPVMSLTESDLAVVQRSNDGSTSQSEITISPHKPRNEKINVVSARIWDQAANYVQTPIPALRADALVAADGAEIMQEVSMPAVFYVGQAYHICGIMLRDSRDPLAVTLPFKLRAYPLELFDGITITLARYGWVNKEFRILGRTFSPEGYIQLTLKETTAAIFAYGTPIIPEGYAENSGLPRPWDIHPPVLVSITSGESELIVQNDGTVVNSVRVTWQPVQDASIISGGTIEVQYQVFPDEAWRSVVVPGTATEARITGVNDLVMVVIRARTRNTLAPSDWSPQVVHQVIGKTEPPPNIENLSISGSILSWSLPRRVPDLAGFVFRFHYGNSLDWNSAAPLHNGLITESPYDLVSRPGGVVTIMGKAQDTSGNQSLATANIVMNLGDPPIANVLEQWDFDALGWPYDASESSGWTIVSGDPTANALDSFYGTDDQSFYGGETEPFYEASAYGQMVYVTPSVSINSVLAGSIMTLMAEAVGVDLTIEYRLSGPGSFYGPDTDSFYDADADPFYGPPGGWMPWPGQIVAQNDAYQFRVTIGAGIIRGVLQSLILTVDAPDMEQTLANVAIVSGGTAIPYTKPFTSIKTVQATLQANGSGAETVEINKTVPMTPVIRAFNSAHVAVSGATADITLKGY